MKIFPFLLLCLLMPPLWGQPTGRLFIHADPGQKVYVDYIFAGITNAEEQGLLVRDLAVGHHRVRLLKSGYSASQHNIEIFENLVVELRITLVPVDLVSPLTGGYYISVYDEGTAQKKAPGPGTRNAGKSEPAGSPENVKETYFYLVFEEMEGARGQGSWGFIIQDISKEDRVHEAINRAARDERAQQKMMETFNTQMICQIRDGSRIEINTGNEALGLNIQGELQQGAREIHTTARVYRNGSSSSRPIKFKYYPFE